MSNIADVPDGCHWDGPQCSQCGNPLIEGEGIGPENALCSECWIEDDDGVCPNCGEPMTDEEYHDDRFHNEGFCN